LSTIQIKKHNELTLKIVTDDRGYITSLADNFTDYVDGYQHMPKWKCGQWDGKVSVFNKSDRTLPYGLLFDLIKWHRKNYKDVTLSVDQKVKDMFIGIEPELDFNLNIFPRPYQEECIEACLKHRSGIIRVATAGGKSGIIAYIIKSLMDNNEVVNSMIVVPTQSLCIQFKNDLIDYGIKPDLIGVVYSKVKETDRQITIITWQSLSKNEYLLDDKNCVIIDEVQSVRGIVLRTLLSKSKNIKWRFGFTGTMPPNKLDTWNVKSYLGPILKEFGSNDLAEQGFISKCNVEFIQVNYNDEFRGDYNKVKDSVFTNKQRLSLIHNTIKNIDDNVLVLVGKVESEGKFLKDYLDRCGISDKEVVFISGDTKVEEREKWRKECEERKNIILIATYGILSVGVNIPSLGHILFASPFKSKIRILQSIGRALRLHKDKEYATIYDIADQVTYLTDHSIKRLRYYIREKFNVNETTVNESELMFFSL
jgi:superfamily II DNA or RNA helicase